MDTLQDAYRDEDDDVPLQSTDDNPNLNPNPIPDQPPNPTQPPSETPLPESLPTSDPIPEPKPETKAVPADPSTDDSPDLNPNPIPDQPSNPTQPPSETPLPESQPTSDPTPDPKPETAAVPADPSTEPEEPKPEPMAVNPVLVSSIAGLETAGVDVEPVTEAEESKTEAEPMAVEVTEQGAAKVEGLGLEEASSDSISEDNVEVPESSDKKEEETQEEDDVEEGGPAPAVKKLKVLETDPVKTPVANGNGTKKSSKKKSKNSNNVWTKTTSRKGKKKARNFNGGNNGANNAPLKAEDTVKITPLPRFLDKNDDTHEAKICLSKVYKADKVELSEDRMSAGSCKGYRMVRATRGVSDGAWFFEIKVVSLGETGHTRLGWSTEKGDLQAPVGYDGCSFGYRDVDGSKVHKALREKYGEEGYKEGDVIGCYISLPEGELYAPKPPQLVWYKGQKYLCNNDSKEDPPNSVPGSEISFFKNGVCQGVAFKDLSGGCYYPAASMYTLPNQPNCLVKFNFGPDFECFPAEFEGRPIPRPMIEVPYHGFDNRVENGVVDESKH